MLPSEERLRRASVFQRAYNKRMVVSTSIVTMYILPKEGKNTGREWKPLTGFVVSTKVSKSAVKRNRAKRLIREVYRLLRTSVFNGERQDIALRDWYAIVFVAHVPALEATYAQIEEAVVSCLIRASSKNRKDRQGVREPGQTGGQKVLQPGGNQPGQPGKPVQTEGRRFEPSGQKPAQGAAEKSPQGAGQKRDFGGKKSLQAGQSKRSGGQDQQSGQRQQSGKNRQQDKNSVQRPAQSPETKS